jgi:hypothetical protein
MLNAERDRIAALSGQTEKEVSAALIAFQKRAVAAESALAEIVAEGDAGNTAGPLTEIARAALAARPGEQK